jgi:methanogenic corrinoid protein MtbC1
MFEPAARRLGDMWSEDQCSEFDVTLGLMRLQSAARLLAAETRRAPGLAVARPVVLIAPAPGELHRLGAALDNSVLETAGWLPQCEYPADDQALQELLADNWFDVLDLSLSAAFRREDWLPRVTATIAEARQASRNPALIVLIGGRAFVDDKTAGSQVGADLATTSSLNVDRAILNTMSATSTTTTLALMQVTATPS